MSLAAKAIEPYQPKAEAPDPTGPGPFAMADRSYTSNILAQAGFSDIEYIDVEKTLHWGDNVDEMMDFQTYVAPLSRMLDEVDETTGSLARQAVKEVFSAE